MRFSGGSGSSSKYETGNEPMPIQGKIFLATLIILILGGLAVKFC